LQRQQDRKGKENSIGNQNKASGEKVERLRITRESDYGKKIAEGDRRPLYAAIRLQQAHDWGTKVATTHTLWRKHYLEYNNCGRCQSDDWRRLFSFRLARKVLHWQSSQHRPLAAPIEAITFFICF
jgi:hypothetical protein